MSSEIRNEIAKKNNSELEICVKRILEYIGEDVNRNGLLDTPHRVAKMYAEITQGYEVKDPKMYLNKVFETDSDGIVAKKDISFFSLCEHHMVPFFGKVHIGYIPTKGKVVGISKLVRVVYAYAKRLQVQEQLTAQIANCIMDGITPTPAGCIVVINAQHLCEVMRGVENATTHTITSEVRGVFRNDRELEHKFFQLIEVPK